MSLQAPVQGEPELVVFEPHQRGMPKLGPYLRELWRRRRFAVHMARSNLKAQHFDTVLGQVWTVLNPLLLAGVYFLLFGVILAGGRDRGPEYLASILAGLFAYYYTRNAMGFGASSIVRGGRLIMNTAFPRALLPVSSVVSAFLTYLPMLAVYAVFHLAVGFEVGRNLLGVPLLLVIHTVFNLGLALVFAALTVYFRDTSSFLPYFLRIWLYVSPVLYGIDDIPAQLRPIMAVNPLYPLFGAWHEALVEGIFPRWDLIGYATLWAVVTLVFGAWFFLSREREFAVRI